MRRPLRRRQLIDLGDDHFSAIEQEARDMQHRLRAQLGGVRREVSLQLLCVCDADDLKAPSLIKSEQQHASSAVREGETSSNRCAGVPPRAVFTSRSSSSQACACRSAMIPVAAYES